MRLPARLRSRWAIAGTRALLGLIIGIVVGLLLKADPWWYPGVAAAVLLSASTVAEGLVRRHVARTDYDGSGRTRWLPARKRSG
jgi:hypothetical protein